MLNFTAMCELIDANAIRACAASGLIVVVELDRDERIAGIRSAHTQRDEAWRAYAGTPIGEAIGIVVPGENGATLLDTDVSYDEFITACVTL